MLGEDALDRARRDPPHAALRMFYRQEDAVLKEAIERYAPDKGTRAVQMLLRQVAVLANKIEQGAVDVPKEDER